MERRPLIGGIRSGGYGLQGDDDVPASSSRARQDSELDVSVRLLLEHGRLAAALDPLPPKVAANLRWKLDKRLIPLIFMVILLQFVDKMTLGASAILGIREDAHLSTPQFNNVASAFYMGFLVFQYPQSLALQKFPVAKWMAVNIFLWAILLACHALFPEYHALFFFRFLLGASEGGISTGMMIILGMYWTHAEIGQRLGWALQSTGVGFIVVTFLAYILQQRAEWQGSAALFKPWRYLMLITSLCTFLTAIVFLILFPDNPTTAWFLSDEEKVQVVRRLQTNRAGIENKRWKREQFIEALTDPKTWVAFLLAIVANQQGGPGVQYAIIIKEIGFTALQTTLLSIPNGLIAITTFALGNALLNRFPNGRALIGCGSFTLGSVAILALLSLPAEYKYAKLIAFYGTWVTGPGWVMIWAMATSNVAGHTKKLTTSAIFLVGYALGQMIAPQYWQEQYRPANVIPWLITLSSYFIDILLLVFLRFYLDKENKRRDRGKLLANSRARAERDEASRAAVGEEVTYGEGSHGGQQQHNISGLMRPRTPKHPFSPISPVRSSSIDSSSTSSQKDILDPSNAFDEAEQEGINLHPEAYEETTEVQFYDLHGAPYTERIDKSLLDMTDRQNLAFRYVL